MRPLRALLPVLLMIGTWLWWRAPVLMADYARLTDKPGVTRVTAVGPSRKAVATVVSSPLATPPDRTGQSNRTFRLARSAHPIEIASVTTLPLVPGMPAKDVSSPRVPRPLTGSGRTEVGTGGGMSAGLSAERGYERLRDRDRRGAAEAFREALAGGSDDRRAAGWRRELASLEKRWSAAGYVFVRDSGAETLSAAPVLGGGQSGLEVAYAIDPLMRRPLQIVSRVTAPNAGLREGAQTAVGVRWRPSPVLSLSAERLLGLGERARTDWTLRVAAGAATDPGARTRWLDASIYIEAGAIGFSHPATYAALQARAGVGTRIGRGASLSLGAGAWASLQNDVGTVDRAEFGPSVRVRAGALDLSADYRVRIAGNARPGSGPALTLAAYF